MSADNVTAILAMALATYATRIAGIVIGERLPRSGRVKQALDALPAAVLTAVVAPAVAAGKAEMIAGAICLVAAMRLPILGVLAVGMASAALLRLVF
jgi:uncharacterized membrane protein